MPDNEGWRPVSDVRFSCLYEVSNFGRVRRSVDGVNTHAGKLLAPLRNASGHLRVCLNARNPSVRVMIHRLVLEAFVGPCPSGMEACHNDNDPSNNRVENLRWDTRSNNQLDRHNAGGWINHQGEKNGRARLTRGDVVALRENPARIAEIAARTGISLSTARRAIRGDTWKDTNA